MAFLDKEVFPREKVCGGGLSRKTLELLQFDLSPIIQRRIRGAYLTYQNRDTVIKDLGERGGVVVLRSDLDRYLAERAVAAGADFFPGRAFTGAEAKADGIRVATSRGPLRARYLFGADGVFSRVRQVFFGKAAVRYVPAVEALVYVDPAILESFQDRVVFDFGGMPGGYGWIFPKQDHLNAGVFSAFGSAAIRRDLAAFMARYRSLGAAHEVKYLGFAIPRPNGLRRFQRGNVWLLGDAAGLAESFFGEGIYFALKSASIAARALEEELNRAPAHLYSDYLRREVLPDLVYSWKSARLFFRFPRFGFYRMGRNRRVAEDFAEIVAGGLGHRRCFYRTLFTSPYWLFSSTFPRAEIEL